MEDNRLTTKDKWEPVWTGVTLPAVQNPAYDMQQQLETYLPTRSEALRDDSFVARQWESFCQENKRYYLHCLHGKLGLLRRLADRLDMLHYFDSREVQRVI